MSCIEELVAEKLRAAATRKTIAGRDFYDLGFLLGEGFDFGDKELLAIFGRKLKEDGFSSDLRQYTINLGRRDKEIEEMKTRVKDESFPVLTLNEQKSFDIQKTLDEMNRVFKTVEYVEI